MNWSWNKATADAPWNKRVGLTLTNVKGTNGDKMWVIGGESNPNTRYNDVWESYDGRNFSIPPMTKT